MTREIKFRAIVNWKIAPVFAIKYRSDWAFVLVWDEISSTTYNINDIVLQQFTWLKDKAWKEIYEWDVVARNHMWTWRMTKHIVKRESVDTWWWYISVEYVWYQDVSFWEVIWNIYENPDLIQTIK